MHKMILTNFLAVKKAEITIDKLVVIIGEQASGKSTVAKSIYFFERINKFIFEGFVREMRSRNKIDEIIVMIFRKSFYNYFGSTKHMHPDLRAEFFYNISSDKEAKVVLTLNQDKKLHVEVFVACRKVSFSHFFQSKIVDEKARKAVEPLVIEGLKAQVYERLSSFFSGSYDEVSYMVAARGATISYPDAFNYVVMDRHKNDMDSYENIGESFFQRGRNVNHYLMADFVSRMELIKSFFRFVGDMKGKQHLFGVQDQQSKDFIASILKDFSSIIKGKYVYHSSYGERIEIESSESYGKKTYVQLEDASSGQQEAIRLIQDVLYSIVFSSKHSSSIKIIEEPENHLFPSSQKKVVDILMGWLFFKSSNSAVITTHSPYVLSVINNYMYYAKLSEEHEAIPKDFGVLPKMGTLPSSACWFYSMSAEGDGIHAKSIKDSETGLISQNYLDQVSIDISNDFMRLYGFHQEALMSEDEK